MNPAVLIIGAGPTGLMMACQLAMRQVPFHILDKTEDHTTQSRALVIHARSLEIFQQMGIAQQAVQQGKIAKAVNLLVNGQRKLRLELGDMGHSLTDFPFLLILEQFKTETLLTNFLQCLGHHVERNTELIEFSQLPHGVSALLREKKGKPETVETQWLIGADGAHSLVREQLAIPFLGKTYVQSLFVLDCTVNLPFPPDEMYLAFSDQTFAGFFPMTNGRCRVIGLVPEEAGEKEDITFEDVNTTFAQQTHLDIVLQNPDWIAKYQSHHRVVSTFRQGRCFLVGDAAHIHSPVGAQGMNTGLQDAYNLAWKLALVINHQAKDALLDTYQDERLGIARQLVKTTDRVFHLVTSENRWLKAYRLQVLPWILKLVLPLAQRIPFLRKKAFVTVSEIGLAYRASQLSQEDTAAAFPAHTPKPGDRLPYCYLRKVFTEGIPFHLLVFSKENPSNQLALAIQTNLHPYADLLQVHAVPFQGDTKRLYNQFGISEEGLYLIRPDSYIAYRSQSLETKKFNQYLQAHLAIPG